MRGRRMMRVITVALALSFSATAALAQGTILQGGPWAPGRAPMYTGQGSGQAVVQDSGPAGGGGTGYGLSEQLLVARGTGTPPYVGQGTGPFGTNWCDYDAPITNPTGYHFLCLSPNITGGGVLSYGAAGGAVSLPFTFNINGTNYTFPNIGCPVATAFTVGCIQGDGATLGITSPGGVISINLSHSNNWLATQTFSGAVVPTRSPGDNTTNAASTAFVQAAIAALPSTALDAICATNNDSLIRLSGTWQCMAYSAQFSVGSTLSIASLSWSLITGTPTTLAGYGITNARTQVSNQQFYVNSSSTTTAPCNSLTCSIGNDSNTCLTNAQACLTVNHVLNLIGGRYDEAAGAGGYNISIAETSGISGATPTRYAADCTSFGPWIGTSVVNVTGDSNTNTNVQAIDNGASVSVANGCTITYQGVHFIDSPSASAIAHVVAGGGHGFAHVDLRNNTYDALAAGAGIDAESGSTISMLGTCAIIGSQSNALLARGGGVIDFGNISCPVSNSLAFSQFAVKNSGGIIRGVSSSTFGTPSGVTGARCNFYGLDDTPAVNPNAIFPGNSDCIVNAQFGAAAVQKGSGSSSTLDYGSSGQCLTSGGGGLNAWTNCVSSGVPQNNLNTQSGNYTIQTTDCGNTINATGAQKTITLPSVSGFASNCVLSVYNANSTRGQILSGFPGALAAAPANVLWPLDTITVEIVNGAWSLQSYPARHKITASITLFVDNTNGNDANDCLAATTSACKTRQGAFNYINTWDGNEQAILVSVAAGTYTNNLTQSGPFHGNPTVTLTGDLSTPSNVLISTTSADALDMSNGATLTMGGFKITTTTGGNGIVVINASFLNITGAMEYGATAAAQLVSGTGSTITITANYTISGGGTVHARANQAAQIIVTGSRTITLSGTPAFSTAFSQAIVGGVVSFPSTTFSGSATGPSFVVSTNALVNNPSITLPGSLGTSTVATHGYVTSPGTPSISSCGGSPGTANGTDFSGNVTEGSTATGCTITFATGSIFTSCTVSLSTGAAVGISTLGATLVVVHASLSGNVLYWTCAN